MQVIMEANETTRNQRLIGYPNPNRPQSWFYFFEDYPTVLVERDCESQKEAMRHLTMLIEAHEESQKPFNARAYRVLADYLDNETPTILRECSEQAPTFDEDGE